MAKVTVLICDDAVMYSTALSHLFRDDPDIEILDRVGTGHEAVERAGEIQPDVVLLDHILPDGVSADFAPRLRERVPGIEIVLVSGLPEAELAKLAEAVGVRASVTKAASLDTLRRTVLACAR